MPEAKYIPLDQIDPPERVLRTEISEAGLRELAASIQAVGLLQPIVVVARQGRFRIIAGHRRYLAHRFLGRSGADCRIVETEEAAELLASGAENTVRRDLSPVEEAQAIRAMAEVRGKSVREIAEALGKSEATIRGRLELLTYPEEFVSLIHSGDLSVAVARELVAVEEDTVRAHYLRCAVESGVSASVARQWRMEWEGRRPLGVTPGEVVAGGMPPIVPMVPDRLCAMCDQAHPITAVQFLALCGGCCRALQEAKNGGGQAA